MKKRGILRYIFSLLLILSTVSFLQAQDEQFYAKEKPREKLQLKSFKIGANAGRFSDYLFKPERESYEGSIDFNLNNKYFGIIEGGYSEMDVLKENYQYISYGSFAKIGMEYNMLKSFPTDFLGVGIKLARAEYRHRADNVILELPHYDNAITYVPKSEHINWWLEASFGIKGQVFKNVYLGWSAIIKVKVSGKFDANFQPLDIPGYGNGENTVSLGANYYIYYQFPIKKK